MGTPGYETDADRKPVDRPSEKPSSRARRFAVVRRGEVILSFETMTDAVRFGVRTFGSDGYSVEHIS